MNFHCIKFLLTVLVLVIPIYAEILFTDVTQSAGITFSGNAEGVCAFDYNNDGLDDILIATRGGANLLLSAYHLCDDAAEIGAIHLVVPRFSLWPMG